VKSAFVVPDPKLARYVKLHAIMTDQSPLKTAIFNQGKTAVKSGCPGHNRIEIELSVQPKFVMRDSFHTRVRGWLEAVLFGHYLEIPFWLRG